MEFKLPLGVVSHADVFRLHRELVNLNDFFVAAKARRAGTSLVLPRLTRLLEQLAKENNINLLEEPQRQNLVRRLQQLDKSVPSLHISFAAEPPTKVIEKILAWFRSNVHPHVMLQVGLQPSIAAGCILRTNNKIFDMSLRRHLDGERQYLVELIKGAIK